MPTDRGAMAILAAGVQQRLVRAEDLSQVVDRMGTLHRRKLIRETIGDIAGGNEALSELDFTWDEYKLAVEIDGAQHTEDPLQRWSDMERDIALGLDGYQVLRFPAWLVRTNPEYVAQKDPGSPAPRRLPRLNRSATPSRLRYSGPWQGAVAQQVRAADS